MLYSRVSIYPDPSTLLDQLGFGRLFWAIRDAGIVVETDSGRVVAWNPAAEALFGYVAGTRPGLILEELVPERWRAQLRAALAQPQTTRQPFALAALRRTGDEIAIEMTISPVTGVPTAGRFALAIIRDITERKRAEDRARREKEFAEQLIESSVDGILAFDQDCRYTIWNPGMERLTGLSKLDVLGRCAFEVFPFLKRTGEDKYLYEALAGRTALAENRRFEVPETGQRGFFEGHYSPLFNEAGEIIGGLAIIRDITERKQAEEGRAQLIREQVARVEAEAAQRQLAAFAQALDRTLAEVELLNSIATEASGEHDLTRILVAALDRLGRVVPFTGGSIALVEGDDLVVRAAVGPFADTALGQRLPRGSGRAWQIVETGQPFIAGDLGQAGSGPTTPLRAYLAAPLVWRGRVFGLLEIDSTEVGSFNAADLALLEKVAVALSGPIELAHRYAAEVRAVAEAEAARRRLAFLAEASVILGSSLDYSTTLTNLARLAVPYLADWCIVYTREADGSIHRLAMEHVDPAKREVADRIRQRFIIKPDAPEGVPKVLRTGRPELHAEASPGVLAAAVDDSPAFAAILQELGIASWMCVPLVASGHVLGAISFVAAESKRRYDAGDLAIAEDLARRAALAADNARLYREAQEAIRARDEFLSVAAHELKTPMTSLRGYAQLLLRRFRRQGAFDPDLFQGALRTIDEQSDKLTRLVGQLLDISRIEAGRLTLERRVIDLAALAQGVVGTTRTTTGRRAIHLHAPATAPALVDSLRLEQVLTNLLGNAVKYSPDDSPIEVEVSLPEPDRVRLSVRDRGLGIPVEHRPRIFDRFYQAHAGGAYAGLGLGLYISRQIVELHGGSIEAEFPPDGGTRLIVSLPTGLASSG